jgi:hypothetical protein
MANRESRPRKKGMCAACVWFSEYYAYYFFYTNRIHAYRSKSRRLSSSLYPKEYDYVYALHSSIRSILIYCLLYISAKINSRFSIHVGTSYAFKCYPRMYFTYETLCRQKKKKNLIICNNIIRIFVTQMHTYIYQIEFAIKLFDCNVSV